MPPKSRLDRATASNIGGLRGTSSRRNAELEIALLRESFNISIPEAEADVAKNDFIHRSERTQYRKSKAVEHLVGYIAARKLLQQDPQLDFTTEEAIRLLEEAKQASLKDMEDDNEPLLKDAKFFVAYLHHYGVSGCGKMHGRNAAHTELQGTYNESEDSANNAQGSMEEPLEVNGHILHWAALRDIASKDVQLTPDEDSIRRGLLPPQPGQRPLKLNTILHHFTFIRYQLQDWHHEMDSQLHRKISRIISFQGHILRWYTTSSLEKLWLRDDQIQRVLAGIWNALPFGATSHSKSRLPSIVLLGLHVVTLCLTVSGPRATSWLDNKTRRPGTPGRFLRWNHVKIRFVGYDKDGMPEFVVYGTVGGSKASSNFADEVFHSFTYGSGNTEHTSLSMDIAMAFVFMAIVQDVMNADLRRCFFDKAHGERLLVKSGTRVDADGVTRYNGHLFQVASKFDDCPVFVVTCTNKSPLKHPSDRVACKSKYPKVTMHPMTSTALSSSLTITGAEIGMLSTISTAIFRRTFSMQSQKKGNMASWQIASAMGHTSGNKSLHRHTYIATHKPQDDAAIRFGTTTTDNVASAISAVGSVATRIDPNSVDEDELASVHTILKSISDLPDDDDEIPSDVRESIIAKYASLSAGKRVMYEDALEALMKLVDGNDDWLEVSRMPHPFDQLNAAQVIEYLEDDKLYACPSCNTHDHYRIKNSTSIAEQFVAYCNCLAKPEHGKRFSCIACNAVFPLAEVDEHLMDCINERLEEKSRKGLTFDNMCVVTGSGRLFMERATFHICPFVMCRDKRMLELDFEEDEAHLRNLVVTRCKHRYEWMGGSGAWEEHIPWLTHIIRHLFQLESLAIQDDEEGKRRITSSVRLAICEGDGNIVCAFQHCKETFTNDDDGIAAYLAHFVNVHRLPIFRYGNGTVLTTLNIDELIGKPTPLPFISRSSDKVPSNVSCVISADRPTDIFINIPKPTERCLMIKTTDKKFDSGNAHANAVAYMTQYNTKHREHQKAKMRESKAKRKAGIAGKKRDTSNPYIAKRYRKGCLKQSSVYGTSSKKAAKKGVKGSAKGKQRAVEKSDVEFDEEDDEESDEYDFEYDDEDDEDDDDVCYDQLDATSNEEETPDAYIEGRPAITSTPTTTCNGGQSRNARVTYNIDTYLQEDDQESDEEGTWEPLTPAPATRGLTRRSISSTPGLDPSTGPSPSTSYLPSPPPYVWPPTPPPFLAPDTACRGAPIELQRGRRRLTLTDEGNENNLGLNLHRT